MTTTRLSGLTLLQVHRDIPVSIDDARDEFARRHPRRMRMTDIRRDGDEDPQSLNRTEETVKCLFVRHAIMIIGRQRNAIIGCHRNANTT